MWGEVLLGYWTTNSVPFPACFAASENSGKWSSVLGGLSWAWPPSPCARVTAVPGTAVMSSTLPPSCLLPQQAYSVPGRSWPQGRAQLLGSRAPRAVRGQLCLVWQLAPWWGPGSPAPSLSSLVHSFRSVLCDENPSISRWWRRGRGAGGRYPHWPFPVRSQSS